MENAIFSFLMKMIQVLTRILETDEMLSCFCDTLKLAFWKMEKLHPGFKFGSNETYD